MLPDTIRNVKIGLAVFVVLFFGSIYGYYYLAQQRMMDRRFGKGERSDPATGSSRIASLNQLEGRDPAAALKLADEIVAKPKSESERRTAAAKRPMLIEWASGRALDGGRLAEAQALRERMEKQHPQSPEATRLRGNWRRYYERKAMDALRGPDRAAEAAAFRELWAQQPRDTDTMAFEALATELVKRWRDAAQAKSADANERMLAAIAVFTRCQAVESMGRDMRPLPGEASALAALGDERARGPLRHTALAFWHGALAKFDDSVPVWKGEKLLDAKRIEAVKTELRRKLGAGFTELGDRLRKGERPEYVVMSPRDAYAGAAQVARGTVEEMEALTHRLDFEAAEVAALAEPVVNTPVSRLGDPSKIDYQEITALEQACHEVRNKIRAALEQAGHRLWECCLETPAFDPWPSVPVAVREACEAGAQTPTAPVPPAATPQPPPRDRRAAQARGGPAPPRAGAAPAAAVTAQAPETQRRKKLAEYYRTDPLHIPLGEVEPLRATLHRVYARWGQLSMKGNPEEAFTMLREVLRESADAGLREEVVQTLRARFASTRLNGDFETFFVVAGFYAAEVGLPARGDPFRDQFRAGLEAALDGFKQGGQMKKIFILSLLAKCFPDEQVGREALREASVTAYSAVAMTPPDKPNAVIMPSTVPGHAVHLINNGTEHHLLAFYRGSSLIMAHYWPWRRGTVVIPEGTYEVVVLSPSSSIRPYREQSSAASGVRLSEYVVKQSRPGGGNAFAPSGSLASGNYTLLYAPPGLGELKVDPRTGIPGRAK